MSFDSIGESSANVELGPERAFGVTAVCDLIKPKMSLVFSSESFANVKLGVSDDMVLSAVCGFVTKMLSDLAGEISANVEIFSAMYTRDAGLCVPLFGPFSPICYEQWMLVLLCLCFALALRSDSLGASCFMIMPFLVSWKFGLMEIVAQFLHLGLMHMANPLLNLVVCLVTLPFPFLAPLSIRALMLTSGQWVRASPIIVSTLVIVAEELIKVQTGALFPVFELMLSSKGSPARLIPFAMHFVFFLFPFPVRCVVHVLWNLMVHPMLRCSLMQSYKAELDLGEIKKSLNPLAPAFRPGLSAKSLYQVVEMGPHKAAQAMREKNWPEYMVKRFESNPKGFSKRVTIAADKSGPVHLEPKFIRRGKFRAPPRISGSTRPNNGKFFAKEFIVDEPPRPFPPLKVCPTHPTARTARLWIASQWHRLNDKGLEVNEKICANLPAEALITSGYNADDLPKLLASARLYVHRFVKTEKPVVRTPMSLMHTVAVDRTTGKREPFASRIQRMTRTLQIGSKSYASPESLEPLRGVMSRQKPTFMAAQAYLAGQDVGPNGAPIDVARLQAAFEFQVNQARLKATRKAGKADMREVLQGNGPSVAVRADGAHQVIVDHHIHLLGRNGGELSGIADVVSELADDPAFSDRMRLATQITLLLVSVYRSSSHSDQLIALMSFVAGNTAVWDSLRTRIRNLVIPQGEDDSWAKTLWEFVFECGLCTMASQLSVGMQELIKNFSSQLAHSFRVEFFRDAGKRAATRVLDAITEFFSRIKSCIKTCSFAPLFGAEWDPVLWEQQARVLVEDYKYMTLNSPSANQYRKDATASGKWPTAWGYCISPQELLYRMEMLVSTGRDLVKFYGKDLLLSRTLGTLLKSVEELATTQRNRLRGAEFRPVPYMVIFYGLPGGGKTNFANMIRKALAKKMNYSLNPASVYHWQTNVNFQTGLTHESWAIMMDDIDQGVAQPVAGKKTHIQEVVDLVNNKPFPVEEADVVLKGTNFAVPHLVLYTTNYKHCKVETNISDPRAFWRRVRLFVTFRAKDEFSNGTGILDPTLAAESVTHEMFDIMVSEYDPMLASGDTPYEFPFTNPRAMSVSEFMQYFLASYEKYMRLQWEHAELQTSEEVHCPMCYLDIRQKACSCGNPTTVQPGEAINLMLADFSRTLDDEDQEVLQGFFAESAASLPTFIESLPALLWAYIAFWCRSIYYRRVLTLRDLVSKYHREILGASTIALSVAVGGLLLASKFVTTQLQGRENNSSGVLGPLWHRADQTFKPSLPPFRHATWTKEDLLAAVKAHVYPIKGKSPCFAFQLSHSTLLVPTHIVPMGVRLEVYLPGRTLTVDINEFSIARASHHEELTIVTCPSLPSRRGLLTYMPASLDMSIHQYDEVLVVDDTRIRETSWNQRVTKGTNQVLATDLLTSGGDCGSVYVGRFGNGWYVVGMHYALSVRNDQAVGSLAACCARDNLVHAAAQIGQVLQGCEVIATSLTKQPQLAYASAYPAKSEYWAACTQFGVRGFPLGTLNPSPTGQTLKTRLKPSVLANASKELRWEFCGEDDYWRAPIFRGSMVEDKWTSPYTKSLEYQNETHQDPYLMALSLMDYLSGMEDLDAHGYAVLSEEQVFTGVTGSYINAMNLATSIGPPHTGKKSQFVQRTEDGVYARDEFWESYDCVHQVLDEGELPVPVCVWTLKDEPLKPGKMPRTFNVYSAGHNAAMKKFYAPIQCFMRANPFFFESFVGINMTSQENSILVTHLQAVDPKLESIYESDVTGMDVSFNGDQWEAIARVDYAIAYALGTGAMEAYSLTLGNKHAVHLVKGDMFEFCRNPSGGADTVGINGKNLSLGYRYVRYWRMEKDSPGTLEKSFPRTVVLEWWKNFFKNPVPPRLPYSFRRNVSLATFGDDALASTRTPFQPSFLEDWKEAWGFRMTDGQKEPTIRPRKFTDCTFLKRRPIYDEELGYYKMALDLKSIARMLAFKKYSVLSDIDAAAVSCTEALRELVYHGEELYERVRTQMTEWSGKHGFSENPLFVNVPYQFWRAQMKKGEYSSWQPTESVAPAQWDSLHLILQGKMTDEVTFVKEGEFSSKVANDSGFAPDGPTHVDHPTGEIAGDGMLVSSIDAPTHGASSFQSPDLGDFMHRFVEIKTGAFSDTDARGVIGTPINLWSDFLSVVSVSNKTANFKWFRGTLEVKIVFSLPANGYGLYGFTALPFGALGAGEAFTASADLHWPNCFQGDHFAVVDCADTTTVSMTLPFVYRYDYADEATERTIWKLYVTCLSPLQTSIPGGVTTGSYRIFVRSPDMELVMPRLQGGKSGQPKQKFSEVAGKVAGVAAKLSAVPVIGSMAAPVAAAAQTISEVSSWFGFTRETAETSAQPMTMRSVSNVAHVDGEDMSELASLSVANAISIDPTIADGHAEDCSSFTSLFDRYTLVHWTVWMPSDAPGAGLFVIPVTPSLGFPTTAGLHMTTAGYVGAPFRLWRGTMHYRIFIPVSKMHRGALQFYWVPDGLTTGAAYTNVTMNAVHEVTSGAFVDLTVGFAQHKGMLVNQPTMGNIPIEYNGKLCARVINPLRSQNPNASTNIFVFAKADADMQFGAPRSNWNMAGLPSGLMAEKILLQGATGDELSESCPCVIVPKSKYPTSELHLGESVSSVRALMQKPSLVYQEDVSKPMARMPMTYYMPGRSDGTFRAGWSYLGYYKALFVGVAFSLRVKQLFPFSNEDRPYVGASAWWSGEPYDLIDNLCPLQIATENGGAEFTIPYYCSRKFLAGNADYPSTPATQSDVHSVRVFGPANRMVYVSAGPDLRITRFRQVPVVGTADFVYTFPNILADAPP